MKDQIYNTCMTSAFGTMNQILKYFEKNLDNDVFETETFGENRFNISENRFARYLKMLLDSEYIEGLKVIDYGEPDFPNQENYHRFKIVLDEPCIEEVHHRIMHNVKRIRDIAQELAKCRG